MIINVLRISTQEQFGYFHIYAKLMGWNTQKNELDFDYSSKHRILQEHSLLLSSQGTNQEASKGLYAIKVRFDTHGIELHEVESLSKAVKKLQTKLVKLDKELGHCDSYGDHMARLAIALGVKDFVVKTNSGDKLRDISSARWYVREKELEWSTYNQIKETAPVVSIVGGQIT